ncbi:hypothetical protein SO694_00004643 [Aureococcus anophagefferens]|uniref:Selenoprotein O n=1 Tax=Aureococcus anophagefferens TaxID=44056 RepID=A0ABR1G9U1_AURAN
MDAANPAFVPREWMLVEAYEAAERGDGAVVDRLAALFRRPYAEDQAQADSARASAARPTTRTLPAASAG